MGYVSDDNDRVLLLTITITITIIITIIIIIMTSLLTALYLLQDDSSLVAHRLQSHTKCIKT